MADLKTSASVISGTIGVDDVVSSKAVIDMTPGLQELYREQDPLFRIYNALPTSPAHNTKINWHLKDLYPTRHYLTTTVAAGAQGATVTLIPSRTQGGSVDVTPFKVGDIVQVPAVAMSGTQTNLGRVTTVNAGVSIVVDPIGFINNAATGEMLFGATTTNDRIHIVADASEEFSQSPTAKVVLDTNEWNYVQFLRVPYVVGNLEMDTKLYTGTERGERREETHLRIRMAAEENLIWGDRYKVAGTNGNQYTSRGFWEYIRQGAGANILNNWTAGFTISDLDEYLVNGPCKAGYGGPTRLWFLSAELYLKLTELMKEKVGNLPEKNMFGLDFEQYTAPGGKRVLMRQHHTFADGNEGKGLMVDPTSATLRPFGTQGTIRLLTDIQENDRAGVKDEWQVIYSLQIDRIEPHGIQTP